MAKKTGRKVKPRKTHRFVVTKRRKPAKKAGLKPARTGGSHVSFGLHGITKIMKKIHEAGLESEFDKAMGHDDKFVKVQRKSLTKIKEFVASRPELTDVATEMKNCDCPPNDPYCIYI
jgi:hypothetical protein